MAYYVKEEEKEKQPGWLTILSHLPLKGMTP